jgi:hypothetical protein
MREVRVALAKEVDARQDARLGDEFRPQPCMGARARAPGAMHDHHAPPRRHRNAHARTHVRAHTHTSLVLCCFPMFTGVRAKKLQNHEQKNGPRCPWQL